MNPESGWCEHCPITGECCVCGSRHLPAPRAFYPHFNGRPVSLQEDGRPLMYLDTVGA